MWAIPSAVLAGRVKMIATAVGADEGDVSTAVHIANLDPLDLEAGLASRPAIVCPDARCMNPSCSGGATNGTMVLSDSSGVVYGIGGRRGAHIFVFKCAGCEAVTGVSTVTLPGGSQLPRSDIAQAKYYVPNHKARQQHTGQTAFESKLLRSFLFDFATVKTMEGWCNRLRIGLGLGLGLTIKCDMSLNGTRRGCVLPSRRVRVVHLYKRTRLYSRNSFRQRSPISLMMMCRSGLAN